MSHLFLSRNKYGGRGRSAEITWLSGSLAARRNVTIVGNVWEHLCRVPPHFPNAQVMIDSIS
jgi:hypothetical protein